MRGYRYSVAFFTLCLGVTRGQKCDSNGVCDKYEQCTKWKEDGTCNRNKVSNSYINVSIVIGGD
jgi:hypothetical protein